MRSASCPLALIIHASETVHGIYSITSYNNEPSYGALLDWDRRASDTYRPVLDELRWPPVLPTARAGLKTSRRCPWVDGSVGWLRCSPMAPAFFVGRLCPKMGREFLASPQTSASPDPCNRKARPIWSMVAIASRAWDCASGVDHARWLLCTYTVMDGDSHDWPPMDT